MCCHGTSYCGNTGAPNTLYNYFWPFCTRCRWTYTTPCSYLGLTVNISHLVFANNPKSRSPGPECSDRMLSLSLNYPSPSYPTLQVPFFVLFSLSLNSFPPLHPFPPHLPFSLTYSSIPLSPHHPFPYHHPFFHLYTFSAPFSLPSFQSFSPFSIFLLVFLVI